MNKNLIIKLSVSIVVIAVCFITVFKVFNLKKESLPANLRNFEALKPSRTSWEQVFKRPSPIRIERLNTGSIITEKFGSYNLKDPGTSEKSGKNLVLKIYSYLIRHDKLGNFLVDAGLNTSIDKKLYGNLKEDSGQKIIYSQKKGMDAASQLKKQNIVPNGIFFTHLNYDSASGLSGFPSNIQCYLDKNEVLLNLAIFNNKECFDENIRLNQFDFTRAQIMEPFGAALDVFGDGSFWAISAPGNTEGNISYLINGQQGPVIITGDAGVSASGAKSGVNLDGLSGNIKISRASIDLIVKFKDNFPQVKLVFGTEL
jgi:N-acyl homoserine lactone hydrolase